MINKATLFFLLIPALLFMACEKDENETQISTAGSDESHNTGNNCMSCHASGQEGEGWFTVAGSIYDNTLINPYTSAMVKLTSEAQGAGTELLQIAVDKKGNFYTTEAVNFGNGLFVSIAGQNGSVKYMNSKITTGQCNSCHGISTAKIGME